MNRYKIYEHPEGSIEAVKLGWSWPAFFFGPLWTPFKNMWKAGGSILVAYIAFALTVPADIFPWLYALLFLVYTVLLIMFGANGNKWWEDTLRWRGYEYKETKTAARPKGAVALYLKQRSNIPVQPEP